MKNSQLEIKELNFNIEYKPVLINNIARNFRWLNIWDTRKNLEDFISEYFKNNNLNLTDVKWTSYKNDNFHFHLNNWQIIQVPFVDFQNFMFKEIWFSDKKAIKNKEKELDEIKNAMESIYWDNHWWVFNWEIDEQDKIKSWKYKNKTLKELKSDFDILSWKLKEVYSITWETSKKLKILKDDLKYFVWIWDKYELWAKYFTPSKEKIKEKLDWVYNNMTTKEMINYIVDCNRIIWDNYKVSDNAYNSNKVFIEVLYDLTFKKLQEEKNDEDCLKLGKDLVKAVTNRWAPWIIWWNQSIWVKDDENFNNVDFANKVLAYLMNDRWILKNNIKDKLDSIKWEKIKVEDKELKWRTPNQIITELENELNNLNFKVPEYIASGFWQTKLGFQKWKILKNDEKKEYNRKVHSSAKEILQELDLEKYIWTKKSYEEMNFEEKVDISTACRILNFIKESSEEELQNPDFIKAKIEEFKKESLNEINNMLTNSINSKILGIDKDTINDLFSLRFDLLNSDKNLLTWEMKEIFDLYQDINGNTWLFDVSDKFKNKFLSPWPWTLTLTVWLIAWVLIIWPALTTATWAWLTWLTLFLATAKAWAIVSFITWVTSNVFDHQWYDTYKEWILDKWTQVTVDTILWAFFTWSTFTLLKKLWLTLNPDLVSWDAWTRAWLIDKWAIVSEVIITWAWVSPLVSSKVKNNFPENHVINQNWQVIE